MRKVRDGLLQRWGEEISQMLKEESIKGLELEGWKVRLGEIWPLTLRECDVKMI